MATLDGDRHVDPARDCHRRAERERHLGRGHRVRAVGRRSVQDPVRAAQDVVEIAVLVLVAVRRPRATVLRVRMQQAVDHEHEVAHVSLAVLLKSQLTAEHNRTEGSITTSSARQALRTA
jgi:hypothetical protein